MQVETITDERYTRGVMFTHVAWMAGIVTATGSAVLLYDAQMSVLAGVGGLFLTALAVLSFAGGRAKEKRGFCYRWWGLTEDEGWWVLDDVEEDDLVDGPVEVEVPE